MDSESSIPRGDNLQKCFKNEQTRFAFLFIISRDLRYSCLVKRFQSRFFLLQNLSFDGQTVVRKIE